MVYGLKFANTYKLYNLKPFIKVVKDINYDTTRKKCSYHQLKNK